MRALLLSLVLVCFSTPPLWAWGAEGHVVVCRIADEYLTPAARAQIKDLLDSRPIYDSKLCNWADYIRSSAVLTRKYKNHSTWHYINIELSIKPEDHRVDLAEDHVISAIAKFRKIIIDPTISKDDRKEALFFLIHFVGDLHQPLHCCHRKEDRGGNLQLIRSFRGQVDPKLNLHRVWDVDLFKVEKQNLSALDFANRLIGEITEEERKSWAKGSSGDWVWESHVVASKSVYQFADGTPLPARDQPAADLTDENYIKANTPVVRSQLKKGGVRLAMLLNEIWAEK
jgi:hypothetical protein